MSDVVPRTLSVEELQPSSDDEEPVPKRQCTEPMKQCSKHSIKKRWRCKNLFPVSDPCKTCPSCRKGARKYSAGDKGKAVKKKYKSGDKGKASEKKYQTSDKGKAGKKKSRDKNKDKRAKYNSTYNAEHKVEQADKRAKRYADNKEDELEKSSKRKAERRADPEKNAHDLKVSADRRARRKADPEMHAHDQKVTAEYRTKNRDDILEKDRKRAKKRNQTLQGRFAKMLREFGVKGPDGSFSTKMQKLGFVDTEDLKDFFRRQFEPGMTFDNHGRQRIDGPRMWNIGHMIIPQYAYDRHLEEEQLRCFHKSNLAPQWAYENLRQGTSLLSDEVLLQHKYLWPMSWKGKLPSAKLRADIQGRRLNREANAYDTASDDSDFDFDFDDSDDEAGPSGVQTMPQDSDSD
jgi:hypothetical protein